MTIRERLAPLVEAANFSRERADLMRAILDELDALDGRIHELAQKLLSQSSMTMTQTPIREFNDTWAHERKGP